MLTHPSQAALVLNSRAKKLRVVLAWMSMDLYQAVPVSNSRAKVKNLKWV